VVLVETVGVGQGEVEVVETADVSLVVLVPGLGDEVQALKAGIMEIADVFVVNKADREGVDRVVAEIQSMLSMAHGRQPEIVQTVGASGQGIDEMLAAVDRYVEEARGSGEFDRRRRAQVRRLFEQTLQERLRDRVRQRALPEPELSRLVERLHERALDPFAAADEVLRRLGL
jgi:LAO/AO transport system kinase